MSRQYIGCRQLEQIRDKLIDRDIEILTSLVRYRLLTTRQICRLHFYNKRTQNVAMRSCNRALAKLNNLRLIDPFERRIGGVRAGSGSYVWQLSSVGNRLLRITVNTDCLPKRRRAYEPSRTFLKHTLAVAEICLCLSEAERHGSFIVSDLQREPDCWRVYNGAGGGIMRLKPDLGLVTISGEFEDYWFLEIDLATEPPSRVIRTCLNYEAYRRSGIEQKKFGVFPAVIWIVPTEGRKSAVQARLDEDSRISPGLFFVILPNELEQLIHAGVENTQQEAEYAK